MTVGDASYKWKAFFSVALGIFFGVVDYSGIGIATPTIASELDLDLAAASWIILSGALTISAALLPVGSLSDAWGRRPSLLAGLAVFAVGSLGAGLAPGLGLLLFARVVAAVGSAMVLANGTAMVAEIFPPLERGRGMGLIIATVGMAAITGPVVAGGLVEAFGWRSFFLLVAAGSFATLWRSATVLRRSEPGVVGGVNSRPYDWAGAFLSTAALIFLILALSSGNSLGWASKPILVGIALGVAALVAFLVRESTARAPMLDLAAFSDRRFSLAVSARFLGFLGNSGYFFLMPFYLQDIKGFAPSSVGLITFPAALGFAVFGAISGRYSDRFGVRRFTVPGLSLVVVAVLILASLDEGSSLWVIMPTLLLNGIGMGLWVAPNMSLAMATISQSSFGVAGALVNLVRNTANVAATAMAASIVVAVMSGRGLDADLSVIQESGSAASASAFVAGARLAYLSFAAIASLALAVAAGTSDHA